MGNETYFYLKDKTVCPHCRVRRRFNPGSCHNCGTRIFTDATTTNFHVFEEGTGIRYWWAWTRDRGFVHRDHFMVEGANPNVKRYFVPELPKDYGMQTTPEEVRKRGGQLRMPMRTEI